MLKLQENIPESSKTNDLKEKTEEILEEIQDVERKIEDRKSETEVYLETAESFNQSLSELESWNAEARDIEEPSALTKDSVKEQLDKLKVQYCFYFRNITLLFNGG